MGDRPAVIAESIKKAFGTVQALDGVDIEVEPGTIFALLGPNGAGKTTLVRILTTLLLPDEGRAMVAGLDVVRDAKELRSRIGLAGQSAAVDDNLTGFENLEMIGRLYHLSRPEARRRATDVLERFELTDAANRTAKTYSGGMRRRLDLGASLVGRPEILFLDEPTTGLDPRSRIGLWDLIRELVNEGATIVLTTQYLEEADRLADSIAVIDVGRVIAGGTSEELKAKIGGEVLEVRVAERSQTNDVASIVSGVGSGAAQVDDEDGRITVPVGEDGVGVLTQVVRRLDDVGVTVSDLSLRRPTLDDVFLSLTGHSTTESERENGERPSRRRRRERTRR